MLATASLSDVSGCPISETIAKHSPASLLTIMSSGQVIVGGSSSITVIICSQ